MKQKDKYKQIIEEITKIRVRVYAGQSLEDTDIDLYNLELFIFKLQDENRGKRN
jgi:hypothetical protein